MDSSFNANCLCEQLYKEAKGNLFPQCQTMKIFSIGPSLWDWYPNLDSSDERWLKELELRELERDTKFRPKAQHREAKVEYCRLNAYNFRKGVEEESDWRDYENEVTQVQEYLKEKETIQKFKWFLRKP